MRINHEWHESRRAGTDNKRDKDAEMQRHKVEIAASPSIGTRDDINKSYLEKLPIRMMDFSNPDDQAVYRRTIAIVQSMLDLHKKLTAAKTAHDKTIIQRQIDTTDKQIDRLVYQLYSLTDDEIKIIERTMNL